MALTSDACHKGLPKSPTGEIPQFKGNLALVYHGSHWSFTTTNCSCLVAVGEGQVVMNPLPQEQLGCWDTAVLVCHCGSASLMDGEQHQCSQSSSLLGLPGC